MTDELRELYQEAILSHAKRPRNRGGLEGDFRHSEGFNPLCGDRIEVSMRIENNKVSELVFEGEGCAISVASASMMTEAVKGKTVAEAQALFERFRHLVTDAQAPELSDKEQDELGDLAVLLGVRELPVRIKCATLAWHAMHGALTESEQVSTE
jgi:nitrogen fixation protein NifU and related proteins